MNCCQYFMYSVFHTSITKGIKEGKKGRKWKEHEGMENWKKWPISSL